MKHYINRRREAVKTFYDVPNTVILIGDRGREFVAGLNHNGDYSYHTIDIINKSVVWGHYGYKNIREAIDDCIKNNNAEVSDYGVNISREVINEYC